MDKIAQFDMKNKDVFQIRDHLSDFIQARFLSIGMDPGVVQKSVGRIMGQLDSILLSPNMDQYKRAQVEYTARQRMLQPLRIRSGLGKRISDEKVSQIMKSYDELVGTMKDYAPRDIPLYSNDPMAAKTLKAMTRLNKYIDHFDEIDPWAEHIKDDTYEFYVNTEEGRMPLGTFSFKDQDEAEIGVDMLQSVSKELASIKGDSSPEAASKRIRLLMSSPLGGPAGHEPENAFENGPSGAMGKAAMIGSAIDSALADLRRIQTEIYEYVNSVREESPDLNISTLVVLFDEIIDDLSQSSVAMQQIMRGKETLDLSQFDTRAASSIWTVKNAVQSPSDAARSIMAPLMKLLKDAIQILAELSQRVQESVFKKASSWLRMAAPPRGLAPVEEPVVAPESMPNGGPAPEGPSGQMVSEESSEDRLIKWEASLVSGAANRGIKEIQDILRDQPFWYQFTGPAGTWV